MMIAGLRLNGVTVYECHERLWHGIEDRVEATSGGWIQPKFWWRVIRAYWLLIIRYLNTPDYDVLIVGYPGQLDVYLARLLARLRHKPLVWDVFMSIYLIAMERNLDKGNQLSIRLLHRIEGMALKLPDMLILDTIEYVNWFCQNYKIHSDRFRLIPTGADDRIFFPVSNITNRPRNIRVLYAGAFIPNHGVKYIVEAADLLKNDPEIIFELIGEGPDLEHAQEFVSEQNLVNVNFINWMAKDALVEHMRQADVCLGAFGKTPQSLMTVQNKIFEAMAMAKPLISGDSSAIRKVCNHLEHIYLCERASGKSLADAIIALSRNPLLLEQIAQNGYKLFTENFSLQKNGQRYKAHLCELIS